jgi:hypothetical protein
MEGGQIVIRAKREYLMANLDQGIVHGMRGPEL